MKTLLQELYVTFSDPRKVRLIWIALAVLVLALAGGAPDEPGWGCSYCVPGR